MDAPRSQERAIVWHPGEFVIVRILGNELPPRDEVGGRVRALREGLAQERLPEGVERRWVLNQIRDAQLEHALRDCLAERNEPILERPPRPDAFARARFFEERVRAAIGLNRARNEALTWTRPGARYTAVLDGDCFFSAEGFAALSARIRADRAAGTERAYYGVPMRRASDLAEWPQTPGPGEEPQLVFHRDAPWTFDPHRPFGHDDKCQLLWRLGHAEGYRFASLETPRYGTAGWVVHLPTGPAHLDADLAARGQARGEAVRQLVERWEADLGLTSLPSWEHR